jgi:hypothetical protein
VKAKDAATKALPFGTALFPGADLVLGAVHVPTDFAAPIKIPAALICLAIVAFARPPRSKAAALRFSVLGAIILAVYLVLAGQLLYTNPRYFVEGDYAVVGVTPSEWARGEAERRHVTMEILRSETGPTEWTALYDRNSQLASAAILGVLYAASFAVLTYGFKRLPVGS